MSLHKPRRALISVSDKRGLIDLAKNLIASQIEIIASDGTAEALRASGIPVTNVSEITGFPEILSGKVKTLHPAIHGAILAGNDEFGNLEKLAIDPIEIVIVNFYNPDFFDIGGPALVRAAAKNHQRVSIITSPDQYPDLCESLNGEISATKRREWARAAIAMTARYDLEILKNLGDELRYGENPHQRGWVSGSSSLGSAQLLQGKAMSYNNYLDSDFGLRALSLFAQPAVVIVKHGIPSGLACDQSIESAFDKALACDPISAFGGVIVANRELDGSLARKISQSFFEVIVAPGFSDAARLELGAKKNLRLIDIGIDHSLSSPIVNVREISGGYLFQERDHEIDKDDPASWILVSGPAIEDFTDLQCAWRTVQNVRSNAIVIASHQATVGIGSGQVSRVDAARIAVMRAGDRARNAVAASDAFFPFPDGLQVLIDAGVKAVVQPGGSARDSEVIDVAKKAGITMYFTGTRHFSHN